MNKQALFTSILSLSLFGLSGCVPVCAAVVVNGVEATVVDANGVAQPDAKVTYTLDDGPEETAECVSTSDDGKGCDTWGLGSGKSGRFVIQAESADGKLHAEATVDVEDGECGPTTEDVTLTLK